MIVYDSFIFKLPGKPASVAYIIKGMRPAHTLSALAPATQTSPRPSPALPDPLSTPIDGRKRPILSPATHIVHWTTCALYSGSCLSSGRGTPSELGAHSLSLRPVTRHTLRKRDTRPTLATRSYAFPAPPTITKTMHRPPSAPSYWTYLYRLCRGGNQEPALPRWKSTGNQPDLPTALHPDHQHEPHPRPRPD